MYKDCVKIVHMKFSKIELIDIKNCNVINIRDRNKMYIYICKKKEKNYV